MRSTDRRNYVVWLSQYRWRVWAVFTFRPGIQLKQARSLFEDWIHSVEVNEGHEVSWLALHERGDGRKLHFHVLIAGISSRIYLHVRHWNSLAGHCHLLKYDSHHPGRDGRAVPREYRGIDYALKSLRSDDFTFDGQLHDQHLLPRYRKERRDAAPK